MAFIDWCRGWHCQYTILEFESLLCHLCDVTLVGLLRLSNGDSNVCIIGLLKELKKAMRGHHWVQCLAYSGYPLNSGYYISSSLLLAVTRFSTWMRCWQNISRGASNVLLWKDHAYCYVEALFFNAIVISVLILKSFSSETYFHKWKRGASDTIWVESQHGIVETARDLWHYHSLTVTLEKLINFSKLQFTCS